MKNKTQTTSATEGIHVAIILDGNGRWATQQGRERTFGHTKGIANISSIVAAAPSLKIHTLTLFAFAIANWKRDKDEVSGLWEIFELYFENQLQEHINEGLRFKHIGNFEGLPKRIQELIVEAEKQSASNTKLLLQVALNYDGIDEVARMTRQAVASGVEAGQIDEKYILSHLDTEVDRDVDVVIRTGMPKPQDNMSIWRSSSFLPLQTAQSVCVGTTKLWPDFSVQDLRDVILYADPDQRLFGGQRG